MKIKKISYIFLICSALILLGLICKYMFLSTEAEKTSLLHSGSLQTTKLDKEDRSIRDSFQMTHSRSHETSPSISLKNKKSGNVFSVKETYEAISPEIDDSTAKTENEKKSYRTVNYNKKHILVKFLPEVEDEIKQGEFQQIHGSLKPTHSKGNFWKVEVGEGESVDDLLENYNTDHSNLVQYAQLDYECDAQGRSGKGSMKNFISEIEEKIKKNKKIFGEQEGNLSQNKKTKSSNFLWYLDDINIEYAWHETSGDPSVVIALLDTGVAYEEAEIQEHEYPRLSSRSKYFKIAPGLEGLNLWTNNDEGPENLIDDDNNGFVDDINGFDFIDYDPHPNDDNGHGTHLANLIANNAVENSIGIASNCSLMNIKVLDHRGKGYSSTLAEGIYYAVDNGADIINLSLAWPVNLDPGPIVHDAILYAHDAGVIIVAGTGNDSRESVCYPSAYNEVIAVGATQFDHTRAYYSNFGPEVEIVAPGGNIYLDQDYNTNPDGIFQETFETIYKFSSSRETLADPTKFGYNFLQGTSMATAMTSGVIALILSLDKTLNTSDIRNILKVTAIDLGQPGKDNEYGHGLINAGGAIAFLTFGGEENWEEGYLENIKLKKIKRGQLKKDHLFREKRKNRKNNNDVYVEDDVTLHTISELQNYNLDNDKDGFISHEIGGLDCDDENPSIYPGAPEIANDGIDQDCNGSDLIIVQDGPCAHPDCLNDPEIDTECDGCLNDEEIGEEYI